MEGIKEFINNHIEEFRAGVVDTMYIKTVMNNLFGLTVLGVQKKLNKLCNVKRIKVRIGRNRYEMRRLYTLKDDYIEPKYKDIGIQTNLC